MPPRLSASCSCAIALGLCCVSSGCIFLGAYPFVQDVTGPVRGVRVVDSDTMRDIPDANASLNVAWSDINQFRADYQSCMHEDEFHLRHVGFLLQADGMRDGLMLRDKDGVFRVRKQVLPGIGVAALCFADGPGYIGPFGTKHGESGYQAVVTAWAPGYKPLQVAYHAPLFAKFDCHGGNGCLEGGRSYCYGYEFDPHRGILYMKLRSAPPDNVETLEDRERPAVRAALEE